MGGPWDLFLLKKNLSFGGPWRGLDFFLVLGGPGGFLGSWGLFLFFQKKIVFKFWGALGGSWGSFSVFFQIQFFFKVLRGPGSWVFFLIFLKSFWGSFSVFFKGIFF